MILDHYAVNAHRARARGARGMHAELRHGSYWHICDITGRSAEVCFWVLTGPHVLTLSSSPFDPKQSSRVISGQADVRP